MKAITLRQPWATFVAMKWKTIETRTHQRFKSLAGQRIAIHAGEEFNIAAFRHNYCPRGLNRFLQNYDIKEFAARYAGEIVCTAKVIDARWSPNVDFVERDQWNRKALCDTAGMFCLFLDDIKSPVTRTPFRGRQGIFEVPADIIGL